MTIIKQINGYEFNILSVDETDYIDEYNVHLFKDSKTILFEFKSEREGVSPRFSISLTEEQAKNFNPSEIKKAVIEILEKEYTIAYSLRRVYEEIDEIANDLKRLNKMKDDFILEHDGEWTIEYYRYIAKSNINEVTLKFDDNLITVDLKTGEAKHSEYVLRNVEVKVRNKDLLLIAIRSKMTNILYESGEESV